MIDVTSLNVDAMTPDDRARAVVTKMLALDAFTRRLGIEVLDVGVGRSVCRMTIRDDMVNGFGTSHGGALFTLADSALAFAVNSDGMVTVAIDCTISYPAVVRIGDILTATAAQDAASRRLGFCAVTVRNQNDVVVGHFRGTVYRTTTPHFPKPES